MARTKFSKQPTAPPGPSLRLCTHQDFADSMLPYFVGSGRNTAFTNPVAFGIEMADNAACDDSSLEEMHKHFYSVSWYGLIPIAVSGHDDAAAGGYRRVTAITGTAKKVPDSRRDRARARYVRAGYSTTEPRKRLLSGRGKYPIRQTQGNISQCENICPPEYFSPFTKPRISLEVIVEATSHTVIHLCWHLCSRSKKSRRLRRCIDCDSKLVESYTKQRL